MKKLLAASILAAVVVAAFGTHSAIATATDTDTVKAEDTVRETRTVDANVSKVRLDSVVHLVLHQGATPALVLSGDRRDVSKVTTVQRGDLLTIGMQEHVHMGGRHQELRADLTVPNLQELVSNGVGPSEVSGFSGDHLTLTLGGAGTIKFTGQYRDVDARLSGVGSMTLDPGHAEQISLRMGGAGEIAVSGQTKALHAHMGGVGSLDAQHLQADTVELDMSGLGSASVYARTAANVSLSGMGSATVYGKPATRNATANGLGKVSWQ
jgi:hypothetical protein